MFEFIKIDAKDAEFRNNKIRFKSFFENFEDYLVNISMSKGSENSGKAKSYVNYLNKLIIIYESSIEKDKIIDLYSWNSYEKLISLKEDDNFKKYNLKEGRFPNATLKAHGEFLNHYFDEKNIEDLEEQIEDRDLERRIYIKEKIFEYEVTNLEDRKEKILIKSGKTYPRDINKAIYAKIRANWSCELNENHTTFISNHNKESYVESHHLIPLSEQNNFEYSIDVVENIIALCPNCHRMIHYGLEKDRIKYLEKLLKGRKSDLKRKGIEISLEKLKEIYLK